MSGQPVTPRANISDDSNVIPTPPPSFPRVSWVTTNGVSRLWSADPPPSPTNQLIRYQPPPCPFPLSPTRPAGFYPEREDRDTPTSPVRRKLFSASTATAGTSRMLSPSPSIDGSPDPANVAHPISPPAIPAKAPAPKHRASSAAMCIEKEPLFLSLSSPEEVVEPLPVEIHLNSGWNAVPTTRRTGALTRDVTVEMLDDDSDDERLTAVGSEQARELSEMMRQTSVADSSQSHRKRKTHDDESDDEITYLWTMETVKRRRVRSSVPRKSVRDELAADDHRREGSVSSGRLPVSGVLSREVRAKLLEMYFKHSLPTITRKGWKEICEEAGARREDYDIARQYLAKTREAIPRMIRHGEL